jgi:hypothetical protein
MGSEQKPCPLPRAQRVGHASSLDHNRVQNERFAGPSLILCGPFYVVYDQDLHGCFAGF